MSLRKYVIGKELTELDNVYKWVTLFIRVVSVLDEPWSVPY